MIITKFQNLKIIWTPGSKLAFPDILSRNITIEENQVHQLRHKRIPRDIEFFDEHGTPVTYPVQHEDNPNDACNDFHPIKYKRGNEGKKLRIQNDGVDFTVNSVLNEFPTNSVQQASDCFRIGRFINQFRRIRGTEAQSSVSANASNTDYNSINSLSSAKDNEVSRDNQYADSSHICTDSEDGNIVCEVSIQADKPRICQAKQAHELVLGKPEAALVKKLLTISDAPYLDTKSLSQKLDEIAKVVDLDVSTILAEQMKDPFHGTVRS